MKIKRGYIHPSSCITVPQKEIYAYKNIKKTPEVGDVVYGEVIRLGQHTKIENKNGRLHHIQDASKSLFVFGNRYAPDYYESKIELNYDSNIYDVVARSGIVGTVTNKNDHIKDPTKIKLLGYVINKKLEIVNTKNYKLFKLKNKNNGKKRSKLILVVGTQMNSGKSMSASACVWSLNSMGYNVRGSKITGTASLKDILYMQDKGASIINDFTYLGFPSTYMLNINELLYIFDSIDHKYCNNPKNYWIVEIADGILQRETKMLLSNKKIQNRIYKLILSTHDALGAVGGIRILRQDFNLIPDAISGICSSSPLAINELKECTDIPVFNNLQPNLNQMKEIIV